MEKIFSKTGNGTKVVVNCNVLKGVTVSEVVDATVALQSNESEILDSLRFNVESGTSLEDTVHNLMAQQEY